MGTQSNTRVITFGILFLSLIFIACDSPVAPKPQPAMTGTWKCERPDSSGQLLFSAVITEDSRELEWGGHSFRGRAEWFATSEAGESCVVSGTNALMVSFVFSAHPGYGPHGFWASGSFQDENTISFHFTYPDAALLLENINKDLTYYLIRQ